MHGIVRRFGSWSAALFLCIALFAGPSGSTLAARQRAPGVLTIGEIALPSALNPLLDAKESTADVTDALFDSLLGTDPHDALVPDLATGYTVSDHGLRYQFTLNDRAH